jgi:ABC-type amino acid transport substrate-binding protein
MKDALRRHIILVSIFVLFCCLVLPQSAFTQEQRRFIAAASAQSPPFSYLDKHNKPQGILIDFWNLWAQKNGAEITFVLTSFEKSIDMVRNGDADFHCGIFSSEQRLQYLDFSNGFLDDSLSLFVLDKLDIKSIADLKKSPLAVGISREYYAVEYIRQHHPYVKIKLYLNNEELLNSAINHEIVAFVVDYPVAFYYLSKAESLGLFIAVNDISSQQLRAAIKKGNLPVLSFINKGITRISKQEMESLSYKWGLRQQKMFPEWLKKALIGAGVVIVLLSLLIYWLLLRREIRKQTCDLDEKNQILTLMQRDVMEVNRTAQSRMEDLEKISRDNEQMLDIIAREMKIPLENIYHASGSGQANDHALDDIHQRSEEALQFIGKFMEIASLDEQIYRRHMEKINLNTFFEKKKKDFKNLARMKQVGLDMEMPSDTITAMLNPEHFDELCNNIFLSVVKDSAPGGKVAFRLSLEEKNGEKRIILRFIYPSIADQEANGNISQKMPRGAEEREHPVESASGIRLAVVQKLIRLQGGSMSAQVEENRERVIVVELPALEEIVKNYEDIEAQLQTGDIILFKGLYYNNRGERSVAADWTHVGIVVRMPGNPSPLVWESTPLDNVSDTELGKKKSGAQLVPLNARLKRYETETYAIRFLKVIRDTDMLKNLFSFIYYAHALPFPHDLQIVAKVIVAKIFSRRYRMKKRYKNIFCSELVAESYIRMGILPEAPPPSAYMPADFSSAKKLPLLKGAYLSGEVMIKIAK